MSSPKPNLPSISEIEGRFPQLNFSKHDVFHWSPKDNCIYYVPEKLDTIHGISQLLHEIGHAVCGHKNYSSGIQLLKIETEAWEKAQKLAKEYGLTIDQKQIDRCLDSYRDWLHIRSVCPECKSVATEVDFSSYRCFNCFQKWTVPKDQRARSYRLKTAPS